MPTTRRPHTSFQRKILTLDSLLRARTQAKRAGQTLVHCHGCFDIVHPGHIRYLQFAKQQGDILLVSLTGDPHVNKGEQRPYVPQELRAENLAALEFVDHVYVNPDPTAVELLAALQPDVYIKGREYEHNHHAGFLKERQTVEAYGGRVIFSSGDVVYSSSHIIDNYAQHLDLEQEKLHLFCRRYNLSANSLNAILNQVQNKPFVIVGDVILDRYQYCDASDLSSDGPMMSLTPLETADFLGGAAALARHLAELGAQPTLLASLGRDDASDAAIDTLEDANVHVLPVRNRKKIATKTRFVVDTQKLFQLDDAPSTPTDSANEKWLVDQVRKLGSTENQPTLIIYDAGLGLITDSVASEILAATPGLYAKTVGGTAGSRGRLNRLRGTNLLVATERALRVAMRDHEQGVSALAYRLLKETEGAAFAMPLGKKGLLCFDEFRRDSVAEQSWEGKLRSEYLASPASTPPVDRLGFDEALLAVAAAALGANANVHQAAYLGLAAALLATHKPGHPPVDPHELHQWLSTRPELTP